MANIHAISLIPDEAYLASMGLKPIFFQTEITWDLKYLIIHVCDYENPIEKAEGEKRFKQMGVSPDIVKPHTLVGIGEAIFFEYDDKTFKQDIPIHGVNEPLMVWKTELGIAGDPLYGIRFIELYGIDEKPIELKAKDTWEGMVWLPETPFEELSFKVALAWMKKWKKEWEEMEEEELLAAEN